MVIYHKKFYWFKVRDHLFDCKTRKLGFLRLNSYSYLLKKLTPQHFGYFCNISHTIINDLTIPDEEIFKKCNSGVKNSINKANTLEIKTSFGFGLEEYYDFFKKFAVAKKIYVPPLGMMKELEPNLLITTASLNENLLVAHCYITDKEMGITRLFQSASQRLNETYDSKTIALANKLLTYQDMLYFKSKGFSTYDFGGYAFETKNQALNGINDFKSSFGGIITINYNYNSSAYQLLLKLSSILDKRFR